MDKVISHAAIVLAGGRSSRMGRDKALVTIDGVPLLRRVCDAARARATTVYVVTGRAEAHEPIVPEDCRIIREPPPALGPLIAFSRVLPLVETEWTLLLACDLPRLTPEVIGRQAALLPTVPEGAIALVPRLEGRWEPLCGFYHRRCLDGLRDFIARGGDSFQGWLEEAIVRELPVPDPGVLFNCNTPADLEIVINSPDNHPDEKHHQRDIE